MPNYIKMKAYILGIFYFSPVMESRTQMARTRPRPGLENVSLRILEAKDMSSRTPSLLLTDSTATVLQ